MMVRIRGGISSGNGRENNGHRRQRTGTRGKTFEMVRGHQCAIDGSADCSNGWGY